MATQKWTAGRTAASVIVGVVLVAVVLGLAAFAGGWRFDTQASGDAGESGSEVGMHEVTDMAGRTVSLPVEPDNIAAADAFSANVCVLAGAGSQLMGAPNGVISNELLKRVYPDLENVTSLAGNSINVEEMLSAGVDVVIIKKDLYSSGEGVSSLEAVGIPYVVVGYDTIEEQMQAIQLIADVCGGSAQQKAQQINQYYADTISMVEERVAGLSDEEKVRVYHAVNDPLLTDGALSLGTDWIERSGAVDVSVEAGAAGTSGDYSATLEQVYVWDPDVIVCNSTSAKNQILSDPQWAGLRAVQEGKVYNLPVSTSRWGQRGDPETFFAMLWMGTTLHPDLFADVNLKNTVISYYRDIVGIEIDDATWDQIVAGTGLRADSASGGGNGSGAGTGGGSGTGSGSGSGSGTGGGNGSGGGNGNGSGGK